MVHCLLFKECIHERKKMIVWDYRLLFLELRPSGLYFDRVASHWSPAEDPNMLSHLPLTSKNELIPLKPVMWNNNADMFLKSVQSSQSSGPREWRHQRLPKRWELLELCHGLPSQAARLVKWAHSPDLILLVSWDADCDHVILLLCKLLTSDVFSQD